MPESLKELRRRVKSIKATKQVTRAMEMVSAAKLRRAQGVLMAGRPYAGKLQELLSHLAGSSRVQSHPLFEQREEQKVTMVLFTADRGLCGAFNSNMLRLAEKRMKAESHKKWELICVGKKGADYFRHRNYNIVEIVQGLQGRPDLDIAQKLSDNLRDRFLNGSTDAIYLGYSAFISMAVNRPTITKFLGLEAAELSAGDAKATPGGDLDYILEPSADRLFDALLPRYLTSKIYITMAEVFTAEHSARMVAMSNATKSCDELVESLTLRLNKARQASITNELIDIVSGAQAISG